MTRQLSEIDAHHVLSETMDVSKAIIKAGEDGRYDALERRTINQEAREAIRALERVVVATREG
ncbi:hypothetical protein D3C71_2252620 [compost metagenome]